MVEHSAAADSEGGGSLPKQPAAASGRPDIAQLIAEHHLAVYRYAYRLAGAVPDAEDLTQQVFLMAQQRLHQLREPEKARGWLYAVLRSAYLKSCRKQVPMPAANLELDVDVIEQPAVPAEGFDREKLQAAIDGLPDEFKLVVLMFYFEDCSYKEIAEQLDLPLGTVMSRLSRAKGRLREVLSAEHQPQANVSSPLSRLSGAAPERNGNGYGPEYSPNGTRATRQAH